MPVTISGDGGITGLTLSDFGDIDSSALSDADALVYDASAGEWVAEPVDLSAVTGVLPGSALPAGATKQVVQTVKTDTFSTTSLTHVDVTGLSVTITPSSTSSKILVIVDFFDGSPGGSFVNQTRLVRDSTVIYVGDAAGSRTPVLNGEYSTSNAFGHRVAGVYLDSPSSTSATVYKLQTRVSSAGTVYVNRSYDDTDAALRPRAASSITVIEVAA